MPRTARRNELGQRGRAHEESEREDQTTLHEEDPPERAGGLFGGKRSLVPADLRQDADLDSRVLDFNKDGASRVDMGGDEVSEVRLTATSGIDSLGNIAVTGSSFASTLTVTGRPGDVYFVYYSLSFSVDPDFSNFFLPPYGNILLDLASFTQIATGTIGAGGTATFPWNVTLTPPVPDELEVFLQAFIVVPGAGGRGDVTNRLRLELNL